MVARPDISSERPTLIWLRWHHREIAGWHIYMMPPVRPYIAAKLFSTQEFADVLVWSGLVPKKSLIGPPRKVEFERFRTTRLGNDHSTHRLQGKQLEQFLDIPYLRFFDCDDSLTPEMYNHITDGMGEGQFLHFSTIAVLDLKSVNGHLAYFGHPGVNFLATRDPRLAVSLFREAINDAYRAVGRGHNTGLLEEHLLQMLHFDSEGISEELLVNTSQIHCQTPQPQMILWRHMVQSHPIAQSVAIRFDGNRMEVGQWEDQPMPEFFKELHEEKKEVKRKTRPPSEIWVVAIVMAVIILLQFLPLLISWVSRH